MKKRKDYISWDEYFMGIALLSGMRSKDPSTQVGACIVDTSHKIIGIGYNGLPHGIDDDKVNWTNEGSYFETKYPYVVHAELNAILNSTTSLKGATLYVSLFPCNECAKAIIQSGISSIKFLESRTDDAFRISEEMLETAGVQYEKITIRTLSSIFETKM